MFSFDPPKAAPEASMFTGFFPSAPPAAAAGKEAKKAGRKGELPSNGAEDPSAIIRRILSSVERSDEMVRRIAEEKALRSDLVKKLYDQGIKADVLFEGQIYAIGRKENTWFLRKVTRGVTELG